MKKQIPIMLLFFLILTSCQVQVVNQQKPLQNNTLELYKKYTIQTNDGKTSRLEILRQDDESIYGKTKNGEELTISKNDIREVKKTDVLASVGIAAAAILALILIPI